MKLLSWMRTINRSGFDPSKEFKGSLYCLRAKVSPEVEDIRTNSFSFSTQSHDPIPLKTGEELWSDEGGFSGFLAIGTLGRDPETPKFIASVAEDNVTGANEEMAKLVTEKIDKFLEECPEDSSSKQVERSKEEGFIDSDAWPSQGYDLFKSSTEVTKRSNEVKKIKGLLKSVFKRRKAVERECNSMEKHGSRDLFKRIFKKVHISSSKKRNHDGDESDDDDSMQTKKDKRKSVQIFQRKVHPVIMCTPERDDNKLRSCNLKIPNLKIPNLNRGFIVPRSSSKVNKKRENWIKTDAEYHVLEL